MDNATDTSIDKIVEIVSDGDILLVVGPGKTKLRVKSMLMKAISSPFSAMLGPNWKEGHDMRHHDGPYQLSLPDDNATALEIICSVIHFQNDRIPRSLPVGDVLAVAVAADKYDCLNALKFPSKVWLRDLKEKPEDLILLTTAAYLFCDAQAFKELTAALVLNHRDSYLGLGGKEVESVLPWEVFYSLEEQRGFARLEVAEILINGVNSGRCDCGCGWTSTYTHAYISKLEEQSLWPANLSNTSISNALRRVEMMPDPVPSERTTTCNSARWHRVPEYRTSRSFSLERLNKSIGLCLECVRGGSNTFKCTQPSHRSQG
ncbi:uncharacterized protein BKA55DRAFT_598013 [Fusarium redolens]|uniref:BTB domain-containing protein n=1 Tax=Fusarium redolens TaxID=48865 RepID=A0A9P9JVC5_FUSRE|nr:uncharacterized protein BKA55DRAFT_598013 [Fusarium redolens]KAH7233760.1 hypothetical protein BKA55DRAFT_598013 [Fusarium redolens]